MPCFPDVTGIEGSALVPAEARFGIVWGAIGAARACFACCARVRETRVQWGRPIAGFQLTQEKLANMATELNKGRCSRSISAG